MPTAPPPPDSPALSHERHLIRPRAAPRFSIKAHDTADTGPFGSEEDAEPELAAARARLAALQAKLMAEERTGVLVVLQGFDGAGKDHVVRDVIGAMDPAGVGVHNFKKPSGEEQAPYTCRSVSAYTIARCRPSVSATQSSARPGCSGMMPRAYTMRRPSGHQSGVQL